MALKIDTGKLMELLEDFYFILGMHISIFDDECNEILSYPQHSPEFCAQLIKSTTAKKQCDRCDLNAFEKSRSTGSLQIYKCHAGLVDAVTPIKDGSITLGYIMFGQILDSQDKNAAFKAVCKRLSHYELDIKGLEKAFYKLRYCSEQQIRATSRIMEACACYLWLSELVSVKSERLMSKVNKYIMQHLGEQFTVQQLCIELQISRSKLYGLSRQCYGEGVAEYIKRQRLKEAMRWLRETDYPVSRVAELVGISDYNYFYKLFKKETGFSPRQFRAADSDTK